MASFRLLHLPPVLVCAALLLGCAQSKTSFQPQRFWPSWLGGQTESEASPNATAGRDAQAAAPAAPASAPAATANKSSNGQDSRKSELALARLIERSGNTQQARQFYLALMKRKPEDPAPYHRLGVLAAREGKFGEAEKFFQTARGLGPSNADLLSDLGYVYYLECRLPEAETVLREAVAMDPRHQAACNNLGLVLGEQGRYDEAFATFKQVDSEAEAYANLAYVFAQTGDLERAEEAYLHALTLDNHLRVAAGAMLQIADRRQRKATLRAEAGRDERAAPPAPTDPGATARVQISEGRAIPDSRMRREDRGLAQQAPFPPSERIARLPPPRATRASRPPISTAGPERRQVSPASFEVEVTDEPNPLRAAGGSFR
jgi:Flp pilus assembly protein TadD